MASRVSLVAEVRPQVRVMAACQARMSCGPAALSKLAAVIESTPQPSPKQAPISAPLTRRGPALPPPAREMPAAAGRCPTAACRRSKRRSPWGSVARADRARVRAGSSDVLLVSRLRLAAQHQAGAGEQVVEVLAVMGLDQALEVGPRPAGGAGDPAAERGPPLDVQVEVRGGGAHP